MIPLGYPGWYSSVGFFYEATPEVWGKMQCAATTDSSSTTRACCTCNEQRYWCVLFARFVCSVYAPQA
eukprot:2291976-Prymnesium_polylepis.1